MTIMIDRAEIDCVRRKLMMRDDDDAIHDEQGFGHPDKSLDFTIRPISAEWRLKGRRPAYRTARANVQYIWRRSDGEDRFGPMPLWFGERTYDLRAAGLMLPNSAPAWAWQDYEVWSRVDAATAATGDPTAVSAWHILAELPSYVDEPQWERLVRSYIDRNLIRRGAAVAYAIHAMAGSDEPWIVAPHIHLVVAARRFRSGRDHGARVPTWAGSWRAHWRLEAEWRSLFGQVRLWKNGASSSA